MDGGVIVTITGTICFMIISVSIEIVEYLKSKDKKV